METPDAEPFVVFKATCRGAKIDSQGQVCLDIVVPKDHKYECLPITDQGNGILLTIAVWNVREEAMTDNPLADFDMPAGMQMGDGNGERTYRGGKRESADLNKGKEVQPRTDHHRKAYN